MAENTELARKRIALIFNPCSGSKRERRLRDILTACSAIQSRGHEAQAIPTREAGSAGNQAREAFSKGYDPVFACGGDGTVNEVLQGVVGTDAILGVIPLGTANCLANDLGLSLNPAKAADQLLDMQPRRTAAGVIEYDSEERAMRRRYFTAAAGIGIDAELMARTSPGLKRKFGFLAYVMQAAKLYAHGDFPLFSIAFTDAITGERRNEIASQVLVARIGYFGALLKNLVPGASLDRDYAQLAIVKTASRIKYFRYIAEAASRGLRPSRDVEFASARELECAPSLGAQYRDIGVEADGDLLGKLPARISMFPGALRLLMPPPSRKEM